MYLCFLNCFLFIYGILVVYHAVLVTWKPAIKSIIIIIIIIINIIIIIIIIIVIILALFRVVDCHLPPLCRYIFGKFIQNKLISK